MMKILLLLLALQPFAVQGALICPYGQYLFNGACKLCPDNCSICHSASICSECKAGFYGESCSMVCNANCRDNTCDKSKGVCISCSDGYFKDTTKSCIACPSNCSLCSTDTLCTMCKVGFKGQRCQEICTNCKPGTECDIWTGTCYECKEGLTGTSCNKKCDSKCSVCQRLQGDKCSACSNEKYGKTCENVCSLHCVNKTCNDADGFCTHGCQHGYWGALCKDQCMTGCNSHICDRQNGSCPPNYPGGDKGTQDNCPHGCSFDSQDTYRDLNTITTIHEDKRQAPPYVVAPLVFLFVLSGVGALIYAKWKQLKFCTSIRMLLKRNGFPEKEVSVSDLTRRNLECRPQTDITEPGSHDQSKDENSNYAEISKKYSTDGGQEEERKNMLAVSPSTETGNMEASSEEICVVCRTVDNDSGRETTQPSAGISSSSRIRRFLISLEQRLRMRWRRQPIRVEEDTFMCENAALPEINFGPRDCLQLKHTELI